MHDRAAEPLSVHPAVQAPAAILIALGRQALHDVGNLHTSRDWFDQAFQTAERDNDPEGMAQAAIGLGGLWVCEQRASGPWAQTLSRQRQALALLSPGSELAVELRIRLAAEADYRVGRHSRAFAMLDVARRQGPPQTLATALSLAHHCVLGPEHGILRRALAEELLLAASRTERPSDRLMGMLWRTVDFFLDGDPLAERSLAELSSALDRHEHQAVGFAVQAMNVMLCIRSGNFDRAEALAAECLQSGEICGDIDAVGWYQGQLTTIRWFQGRVGELLPMIKLLGKSPEQGITDNSHFAALAVMAATQGDLRLAAGALARLGRGDLSRIPPSSNWLVTLHGAVEAAFLLGDADTAAVAYRLLRPYARLPVMGSLAIACFGSVEHALGLASLTVGDPDRAVAHLRQAIRENLALGHWPAVCVSRYRLAEALTLRNGPGDQDDAAQALARADQESAELGMTRPKGPPPGLGQPGSRAHGSPALGVQTPGAQALGVQAPDSEALWAQTEGSQRPGSQADDALAGSPLAGNPHTSASLAGSPQTGNPQTGNPQTGNPQTGNPLAGNSASLDEPSSAAVWNSPGGRPDRLDPAPDQTQVRLLGPVDLSVGGEVRPVTGLRRKAVLAVLALHAGEVVSTGQLIDAVWGEQVPQTAVNTLQSHISHLRRVFGTKNTIRSRFPGYVLALDGDSTDVMVAERLIRLGMTTTAPEHRIRHLESAIALWRGQALIDVVSLIRLEEQAERLNQLLLQAKQALVAARLALGLHGQVVEDLQSLVLEHPLHEQLHGQLMLALYRVGRQGDALAVYRRLRSALSAELGIAPGQAVRDLETAILRQDVVLDPTSPL
jgi:DNA-binding SARP family transcriptional activator